MFMYSSTVVQYSTVQYNADDSSVRYDTTWFRSSTSAQRYHPSCSCATFQGISFTPASVQSTYTIPELGRAGQGRAGQDSQGLQRGTVRGTYLCQNVSTFDPTATHPKSIRLSVLLEIEASVPTL